MNQHLNSMKKLCFTTLTIVFLLPGLSWIHGQNLPTNLDHLKLANAFFVGSWQGTISNDTVASNGQQYGNAFVINVFNVINGRKSFSYVMDIGFSSNDSKFKGFILYQSGIYMTWIGSFATENKLIGDYVRNFNPEAVVGKFEIVLETPTKLTINNFNLDGVKTGEYEWFKIQ